MTTKRPQEKAASTPPILRHVKRTKVWQGMLGKIEYRIMLVPKDARSHQNDPLLNVEYYTPEGGGVGSWLPTSTLETIDVLSKAVVHYWKAASRAKNLLHDAESGIPVED